MGYLKECDMKSLECEICGGTNLVKSGGVFVCQDCGCKYSVDEVRKMMSGGTSVSTSGASSLHSGNIDTWLNLARKAVDAQNGQQAGEYADKILQADPKYAEAWLIKGKAALLESTVGIDRYAEAMKYFKECAEIIHGRINSPTTNDIRMLRELQESSISMASTRVAVFSKNYIEFQSEETLKRLLSVSSITKSVATANAGIAAPLATHKAACIKVLTGSGMGSAEASRIFSKILDSQKESGEMYADVALVLTQTADTVGKSLISSWENGGHIFDYYGFGPYNDRREVDAWSSYIDGLDDVMRIVLAAIEMYKRPETAKYLSDYQLGERLTKCYDSLIDFQKHARNGRTNHRYHNRLSSGTLVTKDGYFLNESSKQQRDAKIAEWEVARDSIDPVKKMEREREQRERERKARDAAEEEKRKRAVDALKTQYYKTNPEEKTTLDDLSSTLKEASRERDECTEALRRLGAFKRKEKKSLEARIAELKTKEDDLIAEIESSQKRRDDWVNAHLPRLLAIDEGQWDAVLSSDGTSQRVEASVDVAQQVTSNDAVEANQPTTKAVENAINGASDSVDSFDQDSFLILGDQYAGCYAIKRISNYDSEGNNHESVEFDYSNGALVGYQKTLIGTKFPYRFVVTDGEGMPIQYKDENEIQLEKYGREVGTILRVEEHDASGRVSKVICINSSLGEVGSLMYEYYSNGRLKKFASKKNLGADEITFFDEEGICTSKENFFSIGGDNKEFHFNYTYKKDEKGRIVGYNTNNSNNRIFANTIKYDEDSRTISVYGLQGNLEAIYEYEYIPNPSNWLRMCNQTLCIISPALLLVLE